MTKGSIMINYVDQIEKKNKKKLCWQTSKVYTGSKMKNEFELSTICSAGSILPLIHTEHSFEWQTEIAVRPLKIDFMFYIQNFWELHKSNTIAHAFSSESQVCAIFPWNWSRAIRVNSLFVRPLVPHVPIQWLEYEQNNTAVDNIFLKILLNWKTAKN